MLDHSCNDNPTISPVQEPLLALHTESNHRIANNLGMVAALLRMQANELRRGGADLSPEDAAAIIDGASARVDVVGHLHRMLADQADGEVALGDYLAGIGTSAVESMAQRDHTELAIRCDASCTVAGAQAVRIGFLVNELVTNSIKYAHPAAGVATLIELGCRPEPGGALMVWVADDGVGLPDGFDPENDGGLGMRTMRSIARNIGATLRFDSNELGLAATLRIPTATAH